MKRRRAGAGRRRALATAVLTIGAMLAAPTLASAVAPPARGAADTAKPYFDSRVGDSRPGVVSAGERSARARLRSRLGAPGRRAGRPAHRHGAERPAPRRRAHRPGRRAIAAPSRSTGCGPTAPPSGSPRPTSTGSTLSDRTASAATGITHLRYRQSFRGIPAFDNDLRVSLDRGGRILSVTGSPVSGLSVPSVVPDVGAVAAMRALQRDVGVERPVDVTSGPAGDRRSRASRAATSPASCCSTRPPGRGWPGT